MTAAELYEDPDFAGLIFQHWQCEGDERIPAGGRHFAARELGQDWLQRLIDRAEKNPSDFSVRPVFYRDGV